MENSEMLSLKGKHLYVSNLFNFLFTSIYRTILNDEVEKKVLVCLFLNLKLVH